MARIDRFLQAMFDRRAQGLVLAPGKPAGLLTDAGPQAATRDPLTPAQYLPLVREVAGAADPSRLDGLSPVELRYASPAGPVTIEIIPEPDGPRATHSGARPVTGRRGGM
ncbi:MAG TPA: hypothetical protein PKA50_07095, partial [Gemmatimonadales bacterium]|nr:hypothetical protein [Gemmatimonadales bacterium]